MLEQFIKEKEQEKYRANEREKQLEDKNKKENIAVSANSYNKNAFKEVEDKYLEKINSLNH